MKKTCVFAALTLASALALAHARLVAASPANGSTVTPAPVQLRLTYNEPVEAAMSAVKLVGPEGAPIAVDKLASDPADSKTLVQPLPRLAPGGYRVQWHTMGHDGHPMKGELRFVVK